MSAPRLVLGLALVIALLAAASLAPAASATERQVEPQAAHRFSAMTPTEPGDENWATGFGQRGSDGEVFALAVDSANAAVYAGGKPSSYIAQWT